MCRHRFGVLNDLHNELVAEGITDIHIMGMNGFQYINDSNGCMMCDQPDLCSNCEETRHLPWTQDYGNDIWDEGEAFTDEGDGNGEYDDGEEFMDDNHNGVWDEGEMYTDESEGEGNGEYDDGEEFTDTGVVWNMWDITLRDLVILDRDGRYVTQINLTATNPDPSSTCGQNYETIKELLIAIRNQ